MVEMPVGRSSSVARNASSTSSPGMKRRTAARAKRYLGSRLASVGFCEAQSRIDLSMRNLNQAPVLQTWRRRGSVSLEPEVWDEHTVDDRIWRNRGRAGKTDHA